MKKINKSLILIPFLILGCKSSLIEETKLLQRIDTLDMNIYSNQGEKIYSIVSPNSSYNKANHTFNLKETIINLYEDEKIKYIINSDQSRLYNNNKHVELIGNVKFRNIDQDNDILYADSFIWSIDKSTYLLSGNVKFENNNIILTSNKATMNSEEIIEFFNPVKYTIKNENNEKVYEINSENAFYNINTNSLKFGSKDKRVRTNIYF